MTSPSDFVCTTRLGRSHTRDGPASAILRDRPPQKGAAAARRAKKETRDALALPNRFRKNPTLARTARAFRNAAQSHTPARHLGRSPQLGQVRVQGVLVIHPILRHYGAVRASGRRSAPCARSGVVRGTNRWHRARRHDRRCDTRAARTSCAKGVPKSRFLVIRAGLRHRSANSPIAARIDVVGQGKAPILVR